MAIIDVVECLGEPAYSILQQCVKIQSSICTSWHNGSEVRWEVATGVLHDLDPRKHG